jgi:hypothetical protein
MPATGNQLERLEQLLRDVGGVYTITIKGISQASRDKIAFLEAGGRPVVKPSTSMKQAITRFVKAALQGKTPLTAAGMRDAAEEAIHGVVRLRLANEGNDLTWRPNKASTRAAKRKKGLDPRTGVATGKLLRDVTNNAEIVLTKR